MFIGATTVGLQKGVWVLGKKIEIDTDGNLVKNSIGDMFG